MAARANKQPCFEFNEDFLPELTPGDEVWYIDPLRGVSAGVLESVVPGEVKERPGKNGEGPTGERLGDKFYVWGVTPQREFKFEELFESYKAARAAWNKLIKALRRRAASKPEFQNTPKVANVSGVKKKEAKRR